MNQKKDFYKNIIELYFKLDAQKESFLDYKSPSDLSDLLDLWNTSKEGNQNLQDLSGYIEKYIKYSAKTDHPQFLNRMWTGASPASIAGEITSVLQQTCASTYESAPVSTLMEKYMIQQMLDLVWFTSWEGQMTTGSSNANMIAMMTARNLSINTIKKEWLFWSKNLYAFVNEESHYSFDKAVNILWIGSEHLIKVPVSTHGDMDSKSLEKLLEKYSQSGKVFFVAATAGTTVRWAYDNISELLELRKKYNFWLHVDGAWGWPVFFSETLKKKYLQGLEDVDSFTFDFHKMPGIALICNMLLINKKPWALKYNAQSGNTDYIFKTTEEDNIEDLDFWMSSLQCWRKVDSLKLFLDWKYYWDTWYAEKIEKYLALCEYAENYVNNHPRLEMTFKRVSFNICFSYKIEDIETSNKINSQIRNWLYTRSQSLVWSATINKIFFLRLLICNEEIQEVDIDNFFKNVIKLWDELSEK